MHAPENSPSRHFLDPLPLASGRDIGAHQSNEKETAPGAAHIGRRGRHNRAMGRAGSGRPRSVAASAAQAECAGCAGKRLKRRRCGNARAPRLYSGSVSAAPSPTPAPTESAFERPECPRVFGRVVEARLSVSLFGDTIRRRCCYAPIGVLEMVNGTPTWPSPAPPRRGQRIYFLHQASVPMETCSAAMGTTPGGFSAYWGKRRRIRAIAGDAGQKMRLRASVVSGHYRAGGVRAISMGLSAFSQGGAGAILSIGVPGEIPASLPSGLQRWIGLIEGRESSSQGQAIGLPMRRMRAAAAISRRLFAHGPHREGMRGCAP